MSTIVASKEAPKRPIRESLTKLLLAELEHPGTHADQAGTREGLAECLLRDAWRERATDIHLDPQSGGMRVRFRIDSHILDAALLTPSQAARLVNQIKTLAGLDPIATFRPQEARWTYQMDEREVDVRVTTAPCISGHKMAIRVLDPQRVTEAIDELGLTRYHQQRISDWLDSINGMFLCAGPTGSGKTTTLYALLHQLKQRDRAIVTIEDPVEYQIDGISQMQVDPQRGFNFAEGLKAMLRLDPDYLMLGEIRDQASSRVAADASISGRVLLSTLHSRDAVSVVSAMRNWGLTGHEIAVSLSVVVAQRLVRRLCSNCCQRMEPSSATKRWLESLSLPIPAECWAPVGCEKCRQIGYYGAVGVFEVWRVDEDEYEWILHGVDEHALRHRLMEKGHQPLLLDALQKAHEGITSIEELRSLGDVIPPSPDRVPWAEQPVTA